MDDHDLTNRLSELGHHLDERRGAATANAPRTIEVNPRRVESNRFPARLTLAAAGVGIALLLIAGVGSLRPDPSEPLRASNDVQAPAADGEPLAAPVDPDVLEVPASTVEPAEPVADPPAEGSIDPANIISVEFTDTGENFANPERGFHGSLVIADSVYDSADSQQTMSDLYAKQITLARIYVRLDGYRDQQLPAALLTSLASSLEQMRQTGIKVVLRFSYNFGSNEADASIERIEEHIDQLAPTLNEYEDVIAVVPAGFMGAWGEWHSSSNGLDTPEARARIREALLDAVPPGRMVQFRYPRHLTGFAPEPLSAASAFNGSAIARTAHENLCFLSNEHDSGTYDPAADAESQKAYLDAITPFVVMGGETCQITPEQSRADCVTALTELERFHWDYLNLNFHKPTIDRWRDEGCFDEISRRLGYRYRMVTAEVSMDALPGSTLDLWLELANDGFGKLYNPRPLDVVLRNLETGTTTSIRRYDDVRAVLPRSGETKKIDLSVELSDDLEPGFYTVEVALPDAAGVLADDARYAVRFANDGTWRADRGTNDLGVEVAVR